MSGAIQSFPALLGRTWPRGLWVLPQHSCSLPSEEEGEEGALRFPRAEPGL